jgi:hypothetical protein
MRAGGALMVGVCLAPILIPGLPELTWNWPLPGTVEVGAILTVLPAAALVALLAPLVSYRRRDALTVIFFFPAGLRTAWIIGTRLARLPYRNWPAREDVIPLPGRHYAWIAIASNRYHLWRHRHADGSRVLVDRASLPPMAGRRLLVPPNHRHIRSEFDQIFRLSIDGRSAAARSYVRW